MPHRSWNRAIIFNDDIIRELKMGHLHGERYIPALMGNKSPYFSTPYVRGKCIRKTGITEVENNPSLVTDETSVAVLKISKDS